MITWNHDPAILTMGPLEIRWYGLFYLLGFLLGYWLLLKHREHMGLSKKDVEDYIFLLVMGSILGARLFYVLVYNPVYYWNNLLEIPAVWHGGLSIHGGILGAILVTWGFCKKRELKFYAIADLLVPVLALAMVFVRVANYLNGELWGTVTDVPWCVVFPGIEGCRHPSQLYEAAYSLVLFLSVLAIPLRRQGMRFWGFIGLYGLLRFVVTFFRAPDAQDPLFLLPIGQWLSLAMIIAAGVWWVRSSWISHQQRRH